MTREKAKQVFTIDRTIQITGFLILLVGFGVSWGTTQGDIRANAAEIVDVRVDYKAADSSAENYAQTRFLKIDKQDERMQDVITGQAVLLERIVTTTEFIQRDLSILVEQQRE